MKILDRYILRYFLNSFLVVTLAVGLTIIVINMVEQLRDFIDNSIPLISIVEYYIYFGGWVLKSFLPMFVMLAALFSMTMLSRKLEILAMKASGRSLYRIALPIIVASLLLSAGHFYYNEFIYPGANKKRIEMKEFIIESKSKKIFSLVRNVYRQIEPGHFYTIRKFNSERLEGEDLKVYKTKNNRLREIIVSQNVIYKDYLWHATDGIVRYFDDSGTTGFNKFDSLILPEIKDKPEDLSKRLGKPEDMSLNELTEYIELMKRTGGPYLREQVDLKIKYAFPITSFVVTLICIPFATNPKRGSVAVSFAFGAMIALLYFVLFRVMQSAAYNEKLNEYVAVWGINIIFFIIGMFFMFRARK